VSAPRLAPHVQLTGLWARACPLITGLWALAYPLITGLWARACPLITGLWALAYPLISGLPTFALQIVGLEMDLPVIMISGNGDTETVLRGVTHGAVRVLWSCIAVQARTSTACPWPSPASLHALGRACFVCQSPRDAHQDVRHMCAVLVTTLAAQYSLLATRPVPLRRPLPFAATRIASFAPKGSVPVS